MVQTRCGAGHRDKTARPVCVWLDVPLRAWRGGRFGL